MHMDLFSAIYGVCACVHKVRADEHIADHSKAVIGAHVRKCVGLFQILCTHNKLHGTTGKYLSGMPQQGNIFQERQRRNFVLEDICLICLFLTAHAY